MVLFIFQSFCFLKNKMYTILTYIKDFTLTDGTALYHFNN